MSFVASQGTKNIKKGDEIDLWCLSKKETQDSNVKMQYNFVANEDMCGTVAVKCVLKVHYLFYLLSFVGLVFQFKNCLFMCPNN